MRRMPKAFMKPLCARRCASYRLNRSNNRIYNRFIAPVIASSVLEQPSSIICGEYGIVLPQGAWHFLMRAQDAIADAELSDLARALFGDMIDELGGLDLRLE